MMALVKLKTAAQTEEPPPPPPLLLLRCAMAEGGSCCCCVTPSAAAAVAFEDGPSPRDSTSTDAMDCALLKAEWKERDELGGDADADMLTAAV
jgi:hypothetical protein